MSSTAVFILNTNRSYFPPRSTFSLLRLTSILLPEVLFLPFFCMQLPFTFQLLWHLIILPCFFFTFLSLQVFSCLPQVALSDILRSTPLPPPPSRNKCFPTNPNSFIKGSVILKCPTMYKSLSFYLMYRIQERPSSYLHFYVRFSCNPSKGSASQKLTRVESGICLALLAPIQSRTLKTLILTKK